MRHRPHEGGELYFGSRDCILRVKSLRRSALGARPELQLRRKQFMRDFEKMTRDRAYELWEHAGRPSDRSDEFWFAARAEFERKGRTEAKQASGFVRRRVEPPRHESAADWGKRVRDPTTVLRTKAKQRDKIPNSRDHGRATPLLNSQRSTTGTNPPATPPSSVDERSPQSRKRTIMVCYVFGDELKPGARWKRRLLGTR